MSDIEIPIGKRKPLYRFFEMLPGMLSFSMIALPFVLSVINPLWAAIFIVLYIITYFVKAIAMAARTIQGYGVLQRAQQIDWNSRLHDLEDPQASLDNGVSSNGEYLQYHKQQLMAMASRRNRLKPSDMYNAVIIATYNEKREVLEPTIQSVLASDYDTKRIILVLTYEERGGHEIEVTARALHNEYKHKFHDMLIYKHRKGIAGEVQGKGANISYAGRRLERHLKKRGIPNEHVIVTTLDSDNRPHRSYLASLTYEYIVHPDPLHAAFQPLTLFLNNIWDVPAPMRVIATGNSFWNIISSLRPHLLRNFASHSQGMEALAAMNFWSVRTIVEDGHQFWRSYFYFDGKYSVVPIYLPIYQDAVLSDNYRKTLISQFKQVQRWAYGASDIAYVATHILHRHRTVPFFDSFAKLFRLIEGHVSWAASSIIIIAGAFGPILLSEESNRSIIAHQLPTTVSAIQQIATGGLFVQVFIAFRLLPPRPRRYRRHRNIWMVLQWLLMPATSIVYGSIAALNSQTRLLLARYLDRFDVTDKAVIAHIE